jgi:hypothetical protein
MKKPPNMDLLKTLSKIAQRNVQGKAVSAEPTFMGKDEFLARVTVEQERFKRLSVGQLCAELMALNEHLRSSKDPEVRGLIELRAMTLVLVEKYFCEPLKPFTAAATHEAMNTLFVERYVFGTDTEKSWLRLITECLTGFHKLEMTHDPLHWLVDWNPMDSRVHQAKVSLLDKGTPKTLTELFLLLSEREVELLSGTIKADDGEQRAAGNLWQSISDTRIMRGAVEVYWCNHPLVPKDYRHFILEKTPQAQLAFLQAKKQQLFVLGVPVKKQARAKTTEDVMASSSFTLYQQ